MGADLDPAGVAVLFAVAVPLLELLEEPETVAEGLAVFVPRGLKDARAEVVLVLEMEEEAEDERVPVDVLDLAALTLLVLEIVGERVLLAVFVEDLEGVGSFVEKADFEEVFVLRGDLLKLTVA
jgi:hypothetical protein